MYNFLFIIFQAILNETSFGLHRLTQRQGLIHDYEIVLPKSWNIPSCQPGRQMTSVQKANPTRPDIMIDAKLGPIQSQIGPRPWTEQPQGCGEPGFGIHVPSRFLDLERPSPLYKNSWELRTKGKLQLLFLAYSPVLLGFPKDNRKRFPQVFFHLLVFFLLIFCCKYQRC